MISGLQGSEYLEVSHLSSHPETPHRETDRVTEMLADFVFALGDSFCTLFQSIPSKPYTSASPALRPSWDCQRKRVLNEISAPLRRLKIIMSQWQDLQQQREILERASQNLLNCAPIFHLGTKLALGVRFLRANSTSCVTLPL